MGLYGGLPAAALAALLGLAAGPAAAGHRSAAQASPAAVESSSLVLWYDHPAEKWENALPEGSHVRVVDDELFVEGAYAVTLLIAAATSFRSYKGVGGDPAARVESDLRTAAARIGSWEGAAWNPSGRYRR